MRLKQLVLSYVLAAMHLRALFPDWQTHRSKVRRLCYDSLKKESKRAVSCTGWIQPGDWYLTNDKDMSSLCILCALAFHPDKVELEI